MELEGPGTPSGVVCGCDGCSGVGGWWVFAAACWAHTKAGCWRGWRSSWAGEGSSVADGGGGASGVVVAAMADRV